MPVRALILAASISLVMAYGTRAQDGVVDTPEDVQSSSEAATAPDISDESSSYLSGGGFDTGTDTSGSDDDGSDLQPAPMTVTPNE
ncbi:MAG: hypothetical protein AB7G54_06610 [Methyloceanibacter sp.]